jgi:hypothetical protein
MLAGVARERGRRDTPATVTAVLMFGTTEKDSDLFHEIPTVIVDQFPYLEDGRGRRAAVIWPADAVHLPEYGVEVLPREAYGWDELIATTRDEYATWTAVVPRACADLGIRDATVPPQFPVFMADALRAAGHAAGRRRAVRRSPPGQDGARAGGDQARAGDRGGGDGRGPRPDRRVPSGRGDSCRHPDGVLRA